MGYVFVSQGVVFVDELVEDFLVVDGVPGYYRICKEIEAQGLITLICEASFFLSRSPDTTTTLPVPCGEIGHPPYFLLLGLSSYSYERHLYY